MAAGCAWECAGGRGKVGSVVEVLLLNCDARFICEVGCNPKPTIEWRFNGKKIEDGGQYKIKTNGNTRTLIVKKLTAKNAG